MLKTIFNLKLVMNLLTLLRKLSRVKCICC